MDDHAALRIPIYGLGCGGGGAAGLEHVLARSAGVRRVYVNPATETAYVEYDPSRTGPRELADVIERSGYQTGAPVEP